MESKNIYHYVNILYEDTDNLLPEKIDDKIVNTISRSTEVSWLWPNTNLEKTRHEIKQKLQQKNISATINIV